MFKQLKPIHPYEQILLYKSTEKMNRVHLETFQHDTPSAGIFSTRLTVSIPLIVLILLSFSTESHVNEHA